MPSIDVEVDTGAIRALLNGAVGVTLVTTAALAVQNSAKRLCPVDTGRLRDSITWELGMSNGLPSARVGSNVEYASYVELGTRYMSARPFLRPALGAVGLLV